MPRVEAHVREVGAIDGGPGELVVLYVQSAVLLHVEARAERTGAGGRGRLVVVAVCGFERGQGSGGGRELELLRVGTVHLLASDALKVIARQRFLGAHYSSVSFMIPKQSKMRDVR